ncbi:hypothetical protein PMAYCL1PPCAC_17241, partial [Pristionchus mayeri]
QPGVPIPDGGNWMPKPDGVSDVPPGLEYLALVDHIFVKQKKEMLEIAFGWETSNKYIIMNGVGQQIYYAYEESGCCSRQCCGSQRGFIIHIVDNFGREVMRVNREFNGCAGGCVCCASVGSCCAHLVTVEAPPGNIIGSVSQRESCCVPNYAVIDENEKPILGIDSPDCCVLGCGCGDKVFSVKTMHGEDIGGIRKKWAGLLQESFTDADNFGVSFPIDLSVRMKATLIGATFLIDFVHFETGSDNN